MRDLLSNFLMKYRGMSKGIPLFKDSEGKENMYLIIGLGNPGKDYVNTRHNAGFMAIDRLARIADIDVTTIKLNALIGKGSYDGKKVILAKPQTYMNSSGESVRPLVDYFKPEKIIVIYDDIDLDVGAIRVRKEGSAGGHNGMKSIIQHLGTTEFERVRVGIGAKPPRMDLADWVLGHFPKEDVIALDKAMDDVAEAVKLMLADSTDEAMNRYNRKVDRN